MTESDREVWDALNLLVRNMKKFEQDERIFEHNHGLTKNIYRAKINRLSRKSPGSRDDRIPHLRVAGREASRSSSLKTF